MITLPLLLLLANNLKSMNLYIEYKKMYEFITLYSILNSFKHPQQVSLITEPELYLKILVFSL